MTESTSKLCECGCGNPAPIATKTEAGTNRTRGMPMRYIRGHNSPRRTGINPSDYQIGDRGYATPCWIWKLAIDAATGYGRVRHPTRRGGTNAHAASFTQFRGPIPKGFELDHLCRVRECINPDHLEPVTHHENMLRGDMRVKLSPEIARAIYVDQRSNAEIARHYGVTRSIPSRIKRAMIWVRATEVLRGQQTRTSDSSNIGRMAARVDDLRIR